MGTKGQRKSPVFGESKVISRLLTVGERDGGGGDALNPHVIQGSTV